MDSFLSFTNFSCYIKSIPRHFSHIINHQRGCHACTIQICQKRNELRANALKLPIYLLNTQINWLRVCVPNLRFGKRKLTRVYKVVGQTCNIYYLENIKCSTNPYISISLKLYRETIYISCGTVLSNLNRISFMRKTKENIK